MAWAVTEAGRARNRLVDRARAEAAGTGATFDESAHRRGLRRSPDGREAVRREVAAETARRRTIRIDATGGADNAAGRVRGERKLKDMHVRALLRGALDAASPKNGEPAGAEAIRWYDDLRIAYHGEWERAARKVEGKGASRVEIVGFQGTSPILDADGNQFVADVTFKQTRNITTNRIVSTTMDVKERPGETWEPIDSRIEIPDATTERLDHEPSQVLNDGTLRYTAPIAKVYHDRMNAALGAIEHARLGLVPARA